MKPYILQIEHLKRISEGRYIAHIDITDSSKHCLTSIPYTMIAIDAINEEFAKKIAEIRMEEMMITDESELDSIYNNSTMFGIRCRTMFGIKKKYESLIIEMYELRTKQENLLTDLVKNAQTSIKEGLDIKNMGIEVNLDGEQGYLVYAIRAGNEWGLELKIRNKDTNEYEWLIIYEFDARTAEKILSAIMENV